MDPPGRLPGAGEVRRSGDPSDPGGAEVARIEAGGVPVQDRDLVVALGQRHRKLEHEPVELRLRQRIGSLVLDRVLGGRDQKWRRQQQRPAVYRHLALLHRLKERSLSLGRRPVDLIGQQQVGEDRAFTELELRGPGVVDQRSGDISWHQVRRELEPLALQRQSAGHRAHQQRLGHAGNAFEQDMPLADQRDEQPADDRVLTYDGLGDLIADGRQSGTGIRLIGKPGGRSESLGSGDGRLVGIHCERTSLSSSSRSRTSAASPASLLGGGPKTMVVTVCWLSRERLASASATASGAASLASPRAGRTRASMACRNVAAALPLALLDWYSLA